jgi:type IV pilus assembly protein PilW
MIDVFHSASARARQRGASMIETMVGILIGMIVIVVVYNILAVAEGYKRATAGISDAHITGLLSQFVASRDIANGGAGITMSAVSTSGPDLIGCINNEAGNPISGLPVTALDVAVRPIPVLVTDGGAAGVSDSFISLSTGGAHVIWPVDFHSPPASVAAGAAIVVQSPNGFTVPVPTAAAPYWAIVMNNDQVVGSPTVGRCKVVRITNAVLDPATGLVTLTQDPLTATTIAYDSTQPSRFLNLGPQGLATRIRYDVDPASLALRTTELLAVPPAAPNPIAQNIVLMKVQYGIDTNADGTVDCWTAADNKNTCVDGKDYSTAAVRAFDLADLNRILAVRIGIVVRSDEPDLRVLTDPTNPTLKDEAKAVLNGTRSQPWLFNCSTNTNAACQSRIKVPMGPGATAGAPTCAPAVICDYWRYNTYETIVPLRNTIYLATMPP